MKRIIIAVAESYYPIPSNGWVLEGTSQRPDIGLGTHLFVKVPRPGDSEVTFLVFESSCHLLLPSL